MTQPHYPEEPQRPTAEPANPYTVPLEVTTPPQYGQYSTAAPYSTYGGPAAYYGRPPSSPGSTLAVVSLVCSLLGLMLYFPAIAGIVCGHIALSQMKKSGNDEGRGLAIAGLAIGYIITIVGLALTIFAIYAWYRLANYYY